MHSPHIPTGQQPIVFTAQSKRDFYCRDAICEYVFRQGCVPLNPFRAFGYFLSDRVERDAVRQANNNLIRVSDELWVFGEAIADGVLFEIEYARELGMPTRFFSVGTRASEIREVAPTRLRFEHELYRRGVRRKHLLSVVRGEDMSALDSSKQLDLFAL